MFCFKSKKIGYVKKTHGTKGEIVVSLDDKIPKNFIIKDWIFLKKDGYLIPFFLENYKTLDDYTLIIKLKQLNTIDEGKKFLLSEFHVDENLHWIKNFVTYYIGYKIYDTNNILIGTIKNHLPLKNNPLLEVTNDDREILVPYNQELIVKVDYKEKSIKIKLSLDELIHK